MRFNKLGRRGSMPIFLVVILFSNGSSSLAIEAAEEDGETSSNADWDIKVVPVSLPCLLGSQSPAGDAFCKQIKCFFA